MPSAKQEYIFLITMLYWMFRLHHLLFTSSKRPINHLQMKMENFCTRTTRSPPTYFARNHSDISTRIYSYNWNIHSRSCHYYSYNWNIHSRSCHYSINKWTYIGVFPVYHSLLKLQCVNLNENSSQHFWQEISLKKGILTLWKNLQQRKESVNHQTQRNC